MDKGMLERFLTAGMSLIEIGALTDRDPSTVGYWVQKHGLVPNGREKYAPKGGLTREQLEPLVEEGLSLAKMGRRLGASTSTVRYWLRRHGLPTASREYRVRKQRLQEAERTGVREKTASCAVHGLVTFRLDARGSWYCARCRGEAVARRRRRMKQLLVDEAGGRCVLCGYSRYLGALEFHHLDPDSKEFGIAQEGLTHALERKRAEAQKCALLCANCHAEVEGGIAKLPVK